MRRSLLFQSFISLALALASAAASRFGFRPTPYAEPASPLYVDKSLLLKLKPQQKSWPQLHHRRQAQPMVTLNPGMIRHRATTMFKRFFESNRNLRPAGWMVAT